MKLAKQCVGCGNDDTDYREVRCQTCTRNPYVKIPEFKDRYYNERPTDLPYEEWCRVNGFVPRG